MRVLWSLGEGTVHEIRTRLFPERALAYTTVMTVMGHLSRKGLVERHRRGRPFVYRAAVSEHDAREHALDRLTRNFFVSSRDRLRDYLGSPSRTANGQDTAANREAQTEPRAVREIDPSLL